MARKLIITESMMGRLMAESVLNEASASDIVNSNEFKAKIKDVVADAIKNNKGIEKTIEKEVKKIIASSLSEVFKTLWQRKDFWQGMVK